MRTIRTTSIGRLLLLAALPALLGLFASGPVAAQELGPECTNAELGYAVAFPIGWYVNERVDGGELDDVAACRFFSPQDFEVRPQSEVAGIAISISAQSDGPRGGTPTTVGGKPAFVTETETQEDGVEPAGTRHYDYWIEIGPDTWLLADTSDAPSSVGDFEDNKMVLDEMMASLTFDAGGLPDTALPL
jgi:hypothetical protein